MLPCIAQLYQLCPHLLLLVKVTGDFRETLFDELQGYNPRKFVMIREQY